MTRSLTILQKPDAPVIEPLVYFLAIQVHLRGQLFNFLYLPVRVFEESSFEHTFLLGGDALLLDASDATFPSLLRPISLVSVLVLTWGDKTSFRLVWLDYHFL